MNLRSLLLLLLFSVHIHANETARLELPDSGITLIAPDGWVLKKEYGELSIYSPNQPAQGLQSRIHLVRLRDGEESLEAAIQKEIDGVTKKHPESSNARGNYKGSVPVKTASGIAGLRAEFYTEETKDSVTIKYHTVLTQEKQKSQ